MSNSTLNTLLKDYEKKKYNADLTFEREKRSFYEAHPDLNDVNIKLGKIALDISKAVLNNDLNLASRLRVDFNSLKEKKDAILKKIQIPKRSFKAII